MTGSAPPLHFSLNPAKYIKWRVGVQDSEGRRSQSFTIFTHRAAGNPHDDIYIANRKLARSIKVSLHSTGQRQVGFTDTLAKKMSMPNSHRHFEVWNEPLKLADGFYPEFGLRFPTAHLRDRQANAKFDKEVLWLPAAGPGQAVEIIVCTTHQAEALILEINRETFPVEAAVMSDRRFLVLVRRNVRALRSEGERILAAKAREMVRAAGVAADASTLRLLPVYEENGLRGWVDYSVDQLLADYAASI